MKLTHAVYLVPDQAAGKSFLMDVLGFSVSADEVTVTGEPFLTLTSNPSAIDLQMIVCEEQPRIAALKRQAGVVDFILQTDDMDGFINRIQVAGLKIHRSPLQTPYGVTAIFEDPFGTLWDVVQR